MTWFVRHEVVVRVENNPLTCDVEKDPLTTRFSRLRGARPQDLTVATELPPRPPQVGCKRSLASILLVMERDYSSSA